MAWDILGGFLLFLAGVAAFWVALVCAVVIGLHIYDWQKGRRKP